MTRAESHHVQADLPARPSRLGPFRHVVALPNYPSLLVALVLIGFRESMTGPYLTLFAVERAQLSPMALGAFLTVRAAGAIVISILFGAWFDRKPSVLPLYLALVAGVVGYILLSTTTNFGLLLLISALPLGMSTAAFPLIFALAKVHIADADPITAERGIAVLRASFSAAWGIGPAIGAAVVGVWDFNGLFWVSAAFSLLACLPLALSGVRAPDRLIRDDTMIPMRRANLGVILGASSLTLFSMAVAMGAVALPITITLDLMGDKSQVGLAYSVCALLEVPVIMAIAVRPSFFLGSRGMAAGFVALAVYFVVVALAESVGAVITSQALRAIGIGLVSCVGISYLQDLMPGRVGAAAALYSNTSQIGGLLAGLAAGSWAHAFGYHSLFWACAVTSLMGLVFLNLGRRI